ncbi:unnamed protein product [Ostreobium quekettii]|uniref:Uncharacterized protein n=1 Tax=Ostreobium quekettii TaxID=121088 RepID=A0A8S1IYY2_9CHLO|nr:unnamed protein product [Ostreobium quekettii]
MARRLLALRASRVGLGGWGSSGLIAEPRVSRGAAFRVLGTRWEARYDQTKLKNELHGLRRDFKELTRHHGRAEDTVWRLRERLKDLRVEGSAKDRSLDIAKRSVDRLTSEKQRLEARELEEEVRACEARLHASEEVCRHRGEEAQHLQRALDLKAKELSMDAGTDVHSRLLYAVAKGEEECVSLASQLADARGAVRRMEEQLRQNEEESKKLREQSNHAGHHTAALEQQLEDAAATCRQYERETEEVRAQIRELQRKVEWAMLDKSALEEQIDQERSAKQAVEAGIQDAKRLAQIDAENIQAEMSVLLEKSKTENADQRRLHRRKEDELTERCERMSQQVQDLKQMLASSRKSAEESLDWERGRCSKLINETERLAQREKELDEECGNVHAQVDELMERNDRLQLQLEDMDRQRNAECQRSAELEFQVSSLQSAVDSLRGEKTSGESSLRSKVECLLGELHSVIRERDDLRIKLQESSAQLHSTLASHEHMQRENHQLKDTNSSLNKSKTLLQDTMLEQIGAVRSQLDEAKCRNQELGKAISRSKLASSVPSRPNLSFSLDAPRPRSAGAGATPGNLSPQDPGHTPGSSNGLATDSTGASAAVREWREAVNDQMKGISADVHANRPSCTLEELARYGI